MPTPIWVQIVSGDPGDSAFASTRGLGTPLVIDEDSGAAFYLNSSSQITQLGGGLTTYLEMSGDFTATTTTPAESSLSFTPEAEKTYIVEGQLLLETTSATRGPVLTLNIPTGLASGMVSIKAATSSSAEAMYHGDVSTTPDLAVTGMLANTPLPASIQATFRTGVSPSGAFSISLSAEP